MAYKGKDIRIIDADLSTVVDITKDFLNKNNHSFNIFELGDDHISINLIPIKSNLPP